MPLPIQKCTNLRLACHGKTVEEAIRLTVDGQRYRLADLRYDMKVRIWNRSLSTHDSKRGFWLKVEFFLTLPQIDQWFADRHRMNMNEWMNEWMNDWMNEWMNEWYTLILSYYASCIVKEYDPSKMTWTSRTNKKQRKFWSTQRDMMHQAGRLTLLKKGESVGPKWLVFGNFGDRGWGGWMGKETSGDTKLVWVNFHRLVFKCLGM